MVTVPPAAPPEFVGGDLTHAEQRVVAYMMEGRLTSGKVGVWVASAPPGAEMVYHNGFLAVDRAMPGGGRDWLATTLLDEAATALYNAALMGYVVLTQRRVSPKRWQYLARRTSRRRTGNGV